MRRRLTVLSCALCALVPAIAASEAVAASRVVIKGRGFGHGVGMSQYGAYGYAMHGESHEFILGHYYTGTKLARLGTEPEVGVLLQTGRTKVRFTGATRAGARKLSPSRTYAITRNGITAGVVLRSASGRALGKTDGPLRVTAGAAPVKLLGRSGQVTDGRYRGAIEFRSGTFGINAINAVGLEDYVRGVVAGESPSSWPAEALQAQAVAARTYAITTDAGSAADGFTQYPDTRSQVYEGVTGETATTDAAVAATRLQVVTYQDKPVTTYFFSTSGGKTENVENSFLGSSPKPWLKSVDDPYDDASPKHRWTIRLSVKAATRKLRGVVQGSLRSIDVVKHGVSPRIVKASVVGSRGKASIDGPSLRKRFGLYDTWASFTVVTSGVKPRPDAEPKDPGQTPAGDGDSGGVSPGPSAGAAAVRRPRISGRFSCARHGDWIAVQSRDAGGRWSTVAEVQAGARGRYRATLPGPGVYRVRAHGVDGPAVRAR
jgi:stage II sporulation protein D